MVYALWLGLLRHRTYADRRTARRLGSLWRRAARDTAPVGSYDRRGNVDLQDGQTDQAALRPDARSEICDFHGQLLELRWAVSTRLFGLQRRGQNHSG